MSDVAHFLEQIRDTEHRIQVMEAHILENPEDSAIEINLRSLSRRLKRLKELLAQAAEAQHVDICDYRLLPERAEAFPISDVAASLATFQEWITTVYNAVVGGPKERARISKEIRQATTFEFGYSYAGSLGFMLTVVNKEQLFDHDLDAAVERAFEMVRVRDTAQLRELAGTTGKAAIKKLYEWAKSGANDSFSVEIRWKRGPEDRFHVYASNAEMKHLVDIIEGTSDVREDIVELEGRLRGLDVERNQFNFEAKSDDRYRGTLTDDFSRTGKYVVNNRYFARIRIRVTEKFATGEETSSYSLVALSEAPDFFEELPKGERGNDGLLT